MISTKIQDLVLTAIDMEQGKKPLMAYFKHDQLFVVDSKNVNKVRKLVKQLNVNLDVVTIEEEIYA